MCNLYLVLDRIDNHYFTNSKKMYLTLDKQGHISREWHGKLWCLANKIHRACCLLFPVCFGRNRYELQNMFSFSVLRSGPIDSGYPADAKIKTALAQFFRTSRDQGIFDSIEDNTNKAHCLNHIMKFKEAQEQKEIIDILYKLGLNNKMNSVQWNACNFIEYVCMVPINSRQELEHAMPLLAHYNVEEYPDILDAYFQIPLAKRKLVLQETLNLLGVAPQSVYNLKELVKALQNIPIENLPGIAIDYVSLFGPLHKDGLMDWHLKSLGIWKSEYRLKLIREIIDLTRSKASRGDERLLLVSLSKIADDRLEGIGKDCAPFEERSDIGGIFLNLFSRLEKNVRGVITSELSKYLPQTLNAEETIWIGTLAEKLAKTYHNAGEGTQKAIKDTFSQTSQVFRPVDSLVDKCRILLHFVKIPQEYRSLFISTFAEHPEKKSRDILNLISLKIFLNLMFKGKDSSGSQEDSLYYRFYPLGYALYVQGNDLPLKDYLYSYFQGLHVKDKVAFIELAKSYLVSFFLQKEDALTQSMAEAWVQDLYATLHADSMETKASAALQLLKMYKENKDWDCIDYAAIVLLIRDAKPLTEALKGTKAHEHS
jgi:hypothetical protein